MVMRRGFKGASIYIVGALIIGFLFPGCTLLSPDRQKDAKEEKKIFSFLNGYNHKIKEAQVCLKDAGFNPGPIDGKMHRATRRAIRGFQRANGLKATGFVGSATWEKLDSYKKPIKPKEKTKKKTAL